MFVLAGVSGVLIFAVVALLLGALGTASGITAQPTGTQLLTISLLQLAIAVPWLAGMAGMVAMSGQVLDGERPQVLRMYAHGLLRSPLLAIGLGLYVMAVAAAFVVAYVLFLAYVLLLPVGFVGLVAWFVRPRWRRGWLKWLIVVCIPFGLPVFVAVRLALWLPAMVLENAGPVRGLVRSAGLVSGNWFHLAAAGAIALLVLLLLNIPVSLATLGLLSGLGGGNAAAQAAAVGSGLTVVFFGGIPMLALTVVFSRLRASARS